MKIFLLGVLLLIFLQAIGQHNDTMFNHEDVHALQYDTNYIEKCGDVFSIEPWISTPSFSFNLEPNTDSLGVKYANYQPHLRTIFGVDINYRALNVSVGIRGPSGYGAQELYGKTKYSILKLRLNAKRFIYEFYYTKFRGFADRNTPSYDSTRIGSDIFMKRPDLQVQYTKFKAIYIFSHKKFSYGAAYSFTEKQRKTKGTALAVAHLYRMNANADSSMFNKGQREAFGKYDRMKHLDVLSMGVGPGYAAVFVRRKWFFSIGVYLIGDLQYHHANNESNQLISEGWRGALLGDVLLSFGYNGNRFYAGYVLRGDRNLVALPFVNISTTFYSSVFSVGFRINPPKFVPKLYNSSPLKNL